MKISELAIACFNLEGMLTFYKNVFSISFKTIKITKGTIYIGLIDEIQITLCPADMAGIEAKDNRHQLTILVDNIINTVNSANQNNGVIMQDVEESNDFFLATIRDVDGNSIVLKEV